MSAHPAHVGSHFWSNGTEHLDWSEVWCQRCRHDHGMHNGDDRDGCEIMLRAITDQPIPEIIEAGYIIHGRAGLVEESHEVPNMCNSLPAAAFCTKWEPCEPACMVHVNGLVITRIELTTKGWSR